MKKNKTVSNEKELTKILRRLTKRIEDATVDIHEMKSDLKFISLRLASVESNSKIMKVDMEKIRDDIDDLINISQEVLSKMITQKEFAILSQRVSTLENR